MLDPQCRQLLFERHHALRDRLRHRVLQDIGGPRPTRTGDRLELVDRIPDLISYSVRAESFQMGCLRCRSGDGE
ncbi:hypothetical protein AN220_34840 [Streptomyces nanshensis]|nr:hypothetical protein AN220_34840 [Streptomyces nanshensis]